MHLLCLLLLIISLSAPEPIRFIHPKESRKLAGIGGTEIRMQVMLELEPEDRWLDVDLLLGGMRVGGFAKELEGTGSDRIQPFYREHVERHGPGHYVLVARICRGKDVIDNRTVCRNQRAMLAKEIKICGGDVEC